MKLPAVAVAALVGLLASSDTISRPHPTMTCKGYRAPRIVCEARYVDPARPEWTVYASNGRERTDFDVGLVVYLTVPERRFARVEMCVVPDLCVSAWAGWFDHRALFHE